MDLALMVLWVGVLVAGVAIALWYPERSRESVDDREYDAPDDP